MGIPSANLTHFPFNHTNSHRSSNMANLNVSTDSTDSGYDAAMTLTVQEREEIWIQLREILAARRRKEMRPFEDISDNNMRYILITLFSLKQENKV